MLGQGWLHFFQSDQGWHHGEGIIHLRIQKRQRLQRKNVPIRGNGKCTCPEPIWRTSCDARTARGHCGQSGKADGRVTAHETEKC